MHRFRGSRHDGAAVPDHLAGQAMRGGGRSAWAIARQARRDIAGVEAVAGRHWIDRLYYLRYRHELTDATCGDQRAVGAVLDHDFADAEGLQPLDRRLRARIAPQHGFVVIGRQRYIDALERLHEHRAGTGQIPAPAMRPEIAVERDL